ncbi:MAG: glycosyltransferase family 4 protein [Candidatus Pacearchaeota archaeon]
MKILIFAGYFYPHTGGLESYVLKISQKLIKAGNEITIACPNTENYKESETLEKINIIRFKAIDLMKVYPIIYYKNKILSILSKEKFDLIITNTRFFHTSLIGMKFAKKNKIPWIHIEHGTSFVQTNNPIVWLGSRLYDFTFGKKVLKNADKVICISKDSKRFVQSLVNRDVEVVYNGIELSNIPKYTPKKQIKNIIFVGRLIYAKGVQDLINAFAQLENKDLKLTIVGDGPYKKDLEELTKKLNLNNRIIFTGEKNKKEVLDLLSKSDLFINPSYSEGLPTSVLEAGAVGLPVIATDVGGTNEVIINNITGILINQKDPKEIKEAIEFYINHPKEKTKYSIALNKLIKSQFDWNKIIQQWKTILKK